MAWGFGALRAWGFSWLLFQGAAVGSKIARALS